MTFEKSEPNVDFSVIIAGRTCTARQYVGIGSLNVSTPRGEVKAVSGDYILTFGEGEKFVCGEDLFLALAENGIDLDAFAEDDLLDKGGPDPLASSSTSTSSATSTTSTISSGSGIDMSFEILKARAGRGEILTDLEQARLLDGR